MSAEAIARAFEADLPFVGLRDHEHDPDLDRVVPADAARAARALPLSADEARVRVAVADPAADLGALSPYLRGRRVELVIVARDELDAILGPPPVAPPATAAAPPPALGPTLPAQGRPARDPLPSAQSLPPGPPLPQAGPPAPDSSLAQPPPLSPASAAAAPRGSEEEVAGEQPARAADAPPTRSLSAGEEPSPLQAPRRRRVVTTLLVLLLLLVVAGAILAYLLAG